jgi:hypothetical protein
MQANTINTWQAQPRCTVSIEFLGRLSVHRQWKTPAPPTLEVEQGLHHPTSEYPVSPLRFPSQQYPQQLGHYGAVCTTGNHVSP